MRTQNVERDLKRLKAPSAPNDLRTRCLATVPAPTLGRRPSYGVHSAAWRMQRLGLAAGLLAITAVGTAFWSTRPVDNSAKPISSSVAFADAVKAMQNASFCHFVMKSRNYTGKGLSSQWSCREGWLDTKQGAYWTTWDEISGEEPSPLSVKDRLNVVRFLQFPDGKFYESSGEKLTIKSDPDNWRESKQIALSFLSDGVSDKGAGFTGSGKLISAKESLWQGQQVKAFVFQTQPTHQGEPTIHTIFYANRTTNLIVAMRSLAVFKNSPSRLIGETRIDQAKPNAMLFDPKGMERGATVIHRSPLSR